MFRFAIVFFALSVSFAQAENALILAQDNSPLRIESYTSRYKKPDRVGDGTVIHRVGIANTSKDYVSAFGIGFYIFDAFKRDMGRPFVGYSMSGVEVDAIDEAAWEQRPGSAFLFKDYGQGLAYVAIVRMEDGTIWRADESEILKQIEDFEFSLEDNEAE
ncbi:hypothetical protein [Microbulbifer sp. S227A]|uniref:hypothetical protein n=1 Tax=Microbulbifer sp. S227A TaxID=3415131 RepID=UPI003C7AA16D